MLIYLPSSGRTALIQPYIHDINEKPASMSRNKFLIKAKDSAIAYNDVNSGFS